MRYNPDTERGLSLEAINLECWEAVNRSLWDPSRTHLQPTIARVWDCQNGGWIDQARLVPVPV